MKVSVDQGFDDEGDISRLTSRHHDSTYSTKPVKRFSPVLDIEMMRTHVSSIIHRLSERITLDKLRPLPLFLGIAGPTFCLSPRAFTPPAQHVDKNLMEKIKARVTLNTAFFLTNYFVVVLGCGVVVALMNPTMLLDLGLVYLGWTLHEYMIRHKLEIFGCNLGTLLSISQRSTILTIVTVLVVVLKCFAPVLSFLSVSASIILFHAIMRDPTHIEASGELFSNEDCDDDSSGEEVLVERGDFI